jgi:hypothetical protein
MQDVSKVGLANTSGDHGTAQAAVAFLMILILQITTPFSS